MKEVKKRSKKEDFYLTIISLINQSKSPYAICSKFNISKQNAKYYINELKEKGIIRKLGYGVWGVRPDAEKEVKKLLVGVGVDKPTTNLHALQINIPILKGVLRGEDWEIRHKLNNWLPKYKNLSILGGLTLKNNNNKSITIFAKTRNIDNLEEIDNLAFKIKVYVGEFFKREGVILDVFNCKVTNLNIATRDREAEGMVRKTEKFELDLNKKAEKIFKKDDIDAKAWIDNSPYPFSAETNDKEWKRAYLGMPFAILNMFRLMQIQTENTTLFSVHLKSHTKAIIELRKLAKNINNRMSQKRLKDFY